MMKSYEVKGQSDRASEESGSESASEREDESEDEVRDQRRNVITGERNLAVHRVFIT